MIKELTPTELKEKLVANRTTLVLLDVRETKEYEYCHIEGSIHMPGSEISYRLKDIDNDKELVIICHHGMRSLQAASLLVQNGFEQICNLRGGIDSWSREVDPSLPRY